MDAPSVVILPRTVSDPSDPRTAVVTVVVLTGLVARTTATVETDTSLAVEIAVDMSLAVETEAVIAIAPLLVVETTTKSATEFTMETPLAITIHFDKQQDSSRN